MYSNNTEQQYRRMVERVPEKLNEVGVIIDINKIPAELKYLLLRDMGEGDELITEDRARSITECLERLVHDSNKAHQERLMRLSAV